MSTGERSRFNFRISLTWHTSSSDLPQVCWCSRLLFYFSVSHKFPTCRCSLWNERLLLIRVAEIVNIYIILRFSALSSSHSVKSAVSWASCVILLLSQHTLGTGGKRRHERHTQERGKMSLSWKKMWCTESQLWESENFQNRNTLPACVRIFLLFFSLCYLIDTYSHAGSTFDSLCQSS